MELPNFLRHTGDAFGFDEAYCEPSEPRDVFRTVAGPDAAPIFTEVPVEDIVATILIAPMSPIDLQDLLGISLVRGATCDAIGDVG